MQAWVWPGSTNDQMVLAQVRADVAGWSLNRAGSSTARPPRSVNRRVLSTTGAHYIGAEKLRSDTADTTAALSCQGRYQQFADSREGQRGPASDTDRFVVARNRDQG